MLKLAGIVCFIALLSAMVYSFFKSEFSGEKKLVPAKSKSRNNNSYLDKKLAGKKEDPYVAYLRQTKMHSDKDEYPRYVEKNKMR